MDAKTKANFINSVAAGNVKICPNCSSANKPDSKFCIACGTKLDQEPSDSTATQAVAKAPAFAPITDDSPAQAADSPSATVTATPEEYVGYAEKKLVFAEGLPEWDIVPPQVVVRRH